MAEERPLVSIIVRTKDRPKLLRRALQSIAAQTYRPLEVVLVNDGGCDLDVGEIETILGDAALNYVRLEKNTGRAHAGNVGIENANGSYVGFLDDDDEFYPEHVSILANLLGQVDYRAVYADAEIVFMDSARETGDFVEKGKKLFSSRDFFYPQLLVGNFIPLITLLFDREILLSCGGFDEGFELYEDWDLLIRCGNEHPFFHIKRITSRYIQWSREFQIAQMEGAVIETAYDKVLSKHSDKFTPRVVRYFVNLAMEMEEAKDAVISDKDRHIDNIESAIKHKDLHIGNLERHMGDLKTALSDKEAIIQGKDLHIGNVEALLKARDIHITALAADSTMTKAKLLESEKLLDGIYRSNGWKVLLIYYKIRDKIRLIPQKIMRRAESGIFLGESAVKSARYLRNYGLSGFVKKVRLKLRAQRTSIHKLTVPDLKLSKLPEEDIVADESATVSIVIPTKNAGDQFSVLLSAAKKQKGLQAIEIIIVDSGSTDSTVEIANAFGAKVIKMPPERFSHSLSRNLGADESSGKYLFFTVQDALFPSPTFLYELLAALKDNDVGAVSCAEFPREDVDLFYSVLLWHHYKFLDVDRQDRIFANPGTNSYVDLRKNGQLSDLSCLIPRDIFLKYKYRNDYAEDLDLGIRLIRDNYRLAFLSSVRIIHSHNRPPGYHLKRAYVDTISLRSIFPDYPVPPVEEKRLLRDIMAFPLLISFVEKDLSLVKTPLGPENLFDIVWSKFHSFHQMSYALARRDLNCPQLDDGMRAFYNSVADNCPDATETILYEGILFTAVLEYLKIVKEYMLSVYDVIDEKVMDDFKLMLLKTYSMTCGSHLAYCYLRGGTEILKRLHNGLKGEI